MTTEEILGEIREASGILTNPNRFVDDGPDRKAPNVQAAARILGRLQGRLEAEAGGGVDVAALARKVDEIADQLVNGDLIDGGSVAAAT